MKRIYNTSFTWEQCTREPASNTGNPKRLYTPIGQLWGEMQVDSSNEVDEFGARRTMTRGTAYIRQWPAIKGEDHLVDTQFGIVYLVTGVRLDRTANETIVDLESWEGFPN